MSDSAFFSHCSRVDGELLMLKVGIFISQKAPCRALADPSLTRRPDQRELALRLELGLPLIASTNWKIACRFGGRKHIAPSCSTDCVWHGTATDIAAFGTVLPAHHRVVAGVDDDGG
jgi:hypothetical protein